MVLEVIGVPASRRRYCQLCFQDHLNLNLVSFQKKQLIPSPSPPGVLFCPVFVTVSDCTSQEVCLHVQILIEAEKYMRKKWGGRNGKEIRGGKNERGQAVEGREQMSQAMMEHVFSLCGDMDVKLWSRWPWYTLRAFSAAASKLRRKETQVLI